MAGRAKRKLANIRALVKTVDAVGAGIDQLLPSDEDRVKIPKGDPLLEPLDEAFRSVMALFIYLDAAGDQMEQRAAARVQRRKPAAQVDAEIEAERKAEAEAEVKAADKA